MGTIRKAEKRKDAALGCFLGACVGDAAGATLEFLGHLPSHEQVKSAMNMEGGGIWQVAPGQITDDCELAICLAHGLVDSKQFDLEAIAKQYYRWISSKPFDIGTTTIEGLGVIDEDASSTEPYSTRMTNAANERNLKSKSNGSLMRIAPLGIWGHRLGDDILAWHAYQDSGLSHSNQSCRAAAACYSIAVSSLMRDHGDAELAFQRAQKWADKEAGQEVKDWLWEAEKGIKTPYGPLDGFVRIGFTHAFRHLLLMTSYEGAIRETLVGGGDTDTNACIVGGLLGALWGESFIPDHMKNAVLNCNTAMGQIRPSFLSTSQIPTLVELLLNPST